MRSVRLWFSETGEARYISHLDLTRYMIRAFRRTDIPIWYTEGFNPHPHLVFGLSLPLGVAGLNETVDLRLSDDSYTNENILQNLIRVSVPDVTFKNVAEPVFKPLDICFADYTFSVPATADTAESICSTLSSRIESGEIIITKKSKKGVLKSVNVCDYINNYTVNYADASKTADLKLTLPAGNDFTVNPVSFLTSLTENTAVFSSEFTITRNELLLKDGTQYR